MYDHFVLFIMSYSQDAEHFLGNITAEQFTTDDELRHQISGKLHEAVANQRIIDFYLKSYYTEGKVATLPPSRSSTSISSVIYANSVHIKKIKRFRAYNTSL